MALDGIYLYSLVEDLKKSIINILKHKEMQDCVCNLAFFKYHRQGFNEKRKINA